VSELIATSADSEDVGKESAHVTEAVSPQPILITEQAVAFATAAAVALPRTKPTRGVIAALRMMFLKAPGDEQAVPRHYPPRRAAFLENAAMAREMHRL
jgi:hypothetical protein